MSAALPARSLSEHLFAELVLTALAAERRLRPFVGELGADPMLFRGFGTFGRWQEIPHPSRFVRERSEDGDRVGELYTRMIETDANMAAVWEKRVKAVLALPRYIRAADSTPLAQETALFVQTALSLIPVRIVPVSNILEAVIKGVAINEVLWEKATRGPLAGAWLPVDLIDRPMWRFGWSALDRSLHVVTHPGRVDPIPAPPMKFQVLSYGTKDNPWGRALLDRLYWVWFLKRHASKYWAIFVERFAQPLTKGTYPYKADQDLLNKENEDRMLAILNSIRTGSSIALPEGLDITFLEASRGGDASYGAFVAWLEHAEALLMLGEVDTSGLAKGAGSFAKAMISNEVRLETVQHDAHLLGTFESDSLVRWLVHLNFGPDAPIPKSIYDATDAADRGQRMEGIEKSLNDGVAVPLAYYRMTMRIPAPLDDEPVVERQPAKPSPSLSSLRSFASLSSSPSQPRYLVWWTVGDDKVRQRPLHNHAVMHGKVFAIDHPIWNTWWPPAGHNCRCFVGTVSEAEARELGYTGDEPTGPWPIAPDTGLPALPDPGFGGGR